MPHEAKQGFIKNPTNLEEYVHNAEFQMDKVRGWMNKGDYRSAEIKAGYLVKALKKIVAFQKAQTT